MNKITETLLYYFKLGCLGFGGPLAIIAQQQQDLMQDKKWMSLEKFQKALPVIKSMPGPVAYQVILFIALHRVGRFWAMISGVLFVLPSFLLMYLFATQYEVLHNIAWIDSFMRGAQSVAVLLIFWALRDLTRSKLTEPRFWAYAFFSVFLMSFIGVPEPIVILGCGLLAVFGQKMRSINQLHSLGVEIFWICLKAGAVAFGTGLSIVPLLESDFSKWFSHEQFLEAVALGQITPGPVVITVAYLGFRLMGFWGGSIATFAIFLPATLNMLFLFPAIFKKIVDAKWMNDFLLGSLAALSGAIAMSLVALGKELTPTQFYIFLFTLIAGFWMKLPGAVWVLIGGAAHLLMHLTLS